MSEDHDTDELPHVDPDGAPALEELIPAAPRVPTDLSTQPPGPYIAPRVSEDPVLTGVRSLLEEHEKQEGEIARKLAEKVDNVEARAAEERRAMAAKIDKLGTTVESVFDPQIGLPAYRTWIREDFKEAATSIADRFLEPIGTLIKEVAELKGKVMEHEMKIPRLEKLLGRVDTLERELAEVKEQLAALVGDAK